MFHTSSFQFGCDITDVEASTNSIWITFGPSDSQLGGALEPATDYKIGIQLMSGGSIYMGLFFTMTTSSLMITSYQSPITLLPIGVPLEVTIRHYNDAYLTLYLMP
jgi:hypothetical protein